MLRRLHRATLRALRAGAVVACFGASLGGCFGTAELGQRPERPGPAAPASEEWRTYVPERCRGVNGGATEGCRTRRIVTTSTSIEILEPVGFVDNTAQPTPASYRTIAAVARTLLDNPSILLLEVRGHSDSLLHPAERAELARRRAEVVAEHLVAEGVDAARLTTYGASDDELLFPSDDPRNRRVDFVILERDE